MTVSGTNPQVKAWPESPSKGWQEYAGTGLSLLVTFITVVLTGVGIGVALLLDAHRLAWSIAHPITASLIASLCGLPLALLIINLFAQKVITRAEMAPWKVLNDYNMHEVLLAWLQLREPMRIRYSLEKPRMRGDKTSPEVVEVTRELMRKLNTTPPDMTGVTSLAGTTLDYLNALGGDFEHLKEVKLRERLHLVLLPIFQGNPAARDTESEIKAVQGALIDLKVAWHSIDVTKAKECLKNLLMTGSESDIARSHANVICSLFSSAAELQSGLAQLERKHGPQSRNDA